MSSTWHKPDDRPPAHTVVILKCRNSTPGLLFGWAFGMWIPRLTELASDALIDCDMAEYDEERDEYYLQEGYYAIGPGQIEDYCYVDVSNDILGWTDKPTLPNEY